MWTGPQIKKTYGDQVVLRSSNGGEYRKNIRHIKAFNIPDHERAASQSELGSASATAASASATQAMAPKSGTPITTTAPAEIPRMSLPPAAVEIPPKVPVSGAEQPPPLRRSVRVTPSKEIWEGYRTTKNLERLCFVLSLVFSKDSVFPLNSAIFILPFGKDLVDCIFVF